MHLIISIGTFIMEQINHSPLLYPTSAPPRLFCTVRPRMLLGVHLEMIEKKIQKWDQRKRARHDYTRLGDDEIERTKSVAQKWNISTTDEPFFKLVKFHQKVKN